MRVQDVVARTTQWYVHRLYKLVVVCFWVICSAIANGQSVVDPATANLKSGEQIYKHACISCHGVNGTGAGQDMRGFKAPDTFPDFTRCDQTTPEPNTAWEAVITYGGQFRGFSQIMPSFGQALSPEQVRDVVHYLRSFCTNPHWPRGELNLPRALVTEKAFPESEEVISTAVNAQGAPGVETHYIHEQRFGVKNQIEIDIPINFSNQDHVWYGGVGDVTFGYKREIYSNLKKGTIFSLFCGVLAPTGSTDHGFGSGTTTFESFAAVDKLFRSNTFIQTQLGGELPVDTQKAPQAIFWNTAVGQMFAPDRGLGRLWSPMVEVIMNRDFETGAKTNWDMVPQMQVTISRRQHVRADLGVRVPVNNTAGRPVQLMFYLLWDWADGKLTEGW
jgi:mono/diheme cytochrome c family protein